MTKDTISVTVNRSVLQAADADAKAAGLNRSELVERALRNEHLRIALETYRNHTVPSLGIDDYAAGVHQANRDAGL